jgi:hypothetical protein
MATELYRNGTNLCVRDTTDTTRTSLMLDPDYPLTANAGKIQNEIWRNGTTLRYSSSNDSERGLGGYSTGTTTEPAGSVWTFYRNDRQRLYFSNGTNRYSPIPFVCAENSSSYPGITDTNALTGGQNYNIYYYAGSGTNSGSGSIANRYLALGTDRFVVYRFSVTFTNENQQSGADDILIEWYYNNDAGTITSGQVLNITFTPTFGVPYTTNFNPFSTAPKNVGQADTTTPYFRIRVYYNNIGFDLNWSVWYARVPSTYTINQLVY